jgi:hypothetical protein
MVAGRVGDDVGAATVWSFKEYLTTHSKGNNTLTAPNMVDPAGLLSEDLTEASPELMRSLLHTMISSAVR